MGTSNHNIFDVGIEKDIQCKEHADEVVRFYCETCDTCICVLCTFNEHADHEIKQFGEAVPKYRNHIQDMLCNCKNKIEKFDSQLVSLNKAEEIIKETEQLIHNTAVKFISDIKTAEKHIIDELHSVYGKDLLQQIENKKDLSITIDGLRSTCNLTEVILQGKDMERPFVSKAQSKMKNFNDEPPEVTNKETQTEVQKNLNPVNKSKSTKENDSDEDSEDDEDEQEDKSESESDSY